MLKNRFIVGILLSLASIIPMSGYASLLLEPYLGYQFAGNVSSDTVDFGSYRGVGGGGRAAILIFDLLYVGADFSYFPSLGFSSGNNDTFTGGATQTRLGAVAGVSIPILPLRFWLGYNFLDKVKKYDATISSNSFKLGAGIKLIPLVSLNFEYFFTYNGSQSRGNIDTDLDTSGKAILFSASIPLSL